MTKKEVREKAIREIYSSTSLESKGYRCTKKSIYLKSNQYKQTINFSSAISANRLDDVNIFDVRAYIIHEGFRKHRKEKYNLDNGCIGGASIENLFVSGPPYISYDLGIKKEQYDKALEKATKAIENNVFRFFQDFTDPIKLVKNVDQPCFLVQSTIEFLGFMNEQSLIEDLLDGLKFKWGETIEEYLADYSARLNSGETELEIGRETYGDLEKRTALITAKALYNIGFKQ